MIEEARKKRKAADAEKGPGRTRCDLFADFEERLSGLCATIGKGISFTCTFGSVAVGTYELLCCYYVSRGRDTIELYGDQQWQELR